MSMGPPWVTGAGVLATVAFIVGFLFWPTFFVAGVLFMIFLIGLATFGLGRAADTEGTPPDPVTGGRRWWQKRWDE